jgi:hypothetical protein
MGVRTCTFMICALSAILAARGEAKPIPDSEMWEVSSTMQRDGSHTDDAKPTKMPWCPAKYTLDSWPVEQFKAKMREHEDFEGWADAAEHLCEHREDPTWVKQATYLVQLWMNANALKQADAEKEIGAQIASLKEERSPAGQAKKLEAQFEFMDYELGEIKPDPGVDTAKVGDKVPWCGAVAAFPPSDRWGARRIARTIDSKYGIEGTVEGGSHLCERATDTTWRKAAQRALQKWMNWTGQSQPDAERSLRARMNVKFATQRDELCKALEVDTELAGEERTYADARRDFFGCNNDKQTLWQDRGRINTPGVGYYLDADTDVDNVMRAYWLYGYVREFSDDKELPAKDAGDNLPLLYYAIAQDDAAKLDTSAIDKQLAAAPYNDYAKVVANETLSSLKVRLKRYEEALDKMTKGDEDYTTILRTAPKKAFADYDKLHTQWKAEIDRSNAFEKLLSKPSRKVLKGCLPDLLKDAEKIVKAQKETQFKELVEKLGADPIANLLFSRLAVCASYEKVVGLPGVLDELVNKGRNLRGPRSYAYYAVVDALAAATKDRPRILLSMSNFFLQGGALGGDIHFDKRDFEMQGHVPSEWDRDDYSKGVIASTKKVDDGVQITFKTVKLKWPEMDCHDILSHPMRIDPDGTIRYYQSCKATGKTVVQDVTPQPIVISPQVAAPAKAGVFTQFETTSGSAKNGNSFGILVLTKKGADDKKITSFFGFAL